MERKKEHIENYLKIQKFRYEDILEYSIDIEDNLYDIRILKLLLQPIVENSLYHGIKYKRSGGKISVKGYRKDEHIILQVIDNGIGMETKKLESLKNIIKSESVDEIDTVKSSGESFGLYNVAERIRLYYGNEYGLNIDSTENIGTTVSIILPLESDLI